MTVTMRSTLRVIWMVVAILGLSASAPAQTDVASPLGHWITIDDGTKKPRSIVLLWAKNGVVYGTIESIFPEPGQPPDPVCEKCEGYLKNKPIKGMLFMWGLTKDGREWSGGRVVDPQSGSVYKVWIEVVDGGKRLKVRGYLGVSLFGRTQYWERQTS